MQKQRAFLIGAILVVALVLLFAFFFAPGAQTPDVILADPIPAPGEGDGLTGGPAAIGVEITPENVQAVIATLQRATAYSREVRQTRYWNDGASTGTTIAEIWTTPEVLRIRWADGTNMIITEESYHLWFGTDSAITRPVTAALGESLDQLLDRLQGIPNYETVLDLEVAQIIAAGYTQRTIGGETRYTIYIAVETGTLGYISYYYICLTTGLLLETATFDGETPVYRLETLRLTIAPPDPEHFLLPDGTAA